MKRLPCICGIPGCPYETELPEPDPGWAEWFDRALRLFEGETRIEASNPEGESPILNPQRMKRQPYGWRADATWFDDVTVVPRGIPRQEVNLSPEAMGLLRDSLDATLEYYGTSGDLDPRGYWMPIDGEASR